MLNFYWIYDMPNGALYTLIVGGFSLCSRIGIRLTRKLARKLMARPHRQNEAAGIYVSAIGVFYGITLGLITVGASTTFSDISSPVDREATSIASFYPKLSNYPEPIRSLLQGQATTYPNYIINMAWPLQRQGIIPSDIIKQVVAIEKNLDAFEPTTISQSALHEITLHTFGKMAQPHQTQATNIVTRSRP